MCVERGMCAGIIVGFLVVKNYRGGGLPTKSVSPELKLTAKSGFVKKGLYSSSVRPSEFFLVGSLSLLVQVFIIILYFQIIIIIHNPLTPPPILISDIMICILFSVPNYFLFLHYLLVYQG